MTSSVHVWPNMVIMKKCNKCEAEKELSEFYWYSKQGCYSPYCKPCSAQKSREWRQTNRHAYKKQQQNQRRRQYGITSDMFEIFSQMQGGRCAICGIVPSGGVNDTLRVDHDHGTGEVRGLLCFSCNVGLGKFKDSVESLHKAAAYLKAGGSIKCQM